MKIICALDHMRKQRRISSEVYYDLLSLFSRCKTLKASFLIDDVTVPMLQIEDIEKYAEHQLRGEIFKELPLKIEKEPGMPTGTRYIASITIITDDEGGEQCEKVQEEA